MPDDEMWTTTQVAEYLGIRVATVSNYRRRGEMPPPDRTYGTRSHLWHPETIRVWAANRPRRPLG